MVRLNKIYTRTGDAGETGLVGLGRVAKASARMEAIGAVDEANSAIGVARIYTGGTGFDLMLHRIQHDLFDLGADLATPRTEMEKSEEVLRVTAAQVTRLEQEIDAMNAELPALTSFVLPGGCPAAAELYLARALARRAERAVCALAAEEAVGPCVLPYINRLSDHLFVMARAANHAEHDAEVLWEPGVNR